MAGCRSGSPKGCFSRFCSALVRVQEGERRQPARGSGCRPGGNVGWVSMADQSLLHLLPGLFVPPAWCPATPGGPLVPAMCAYGSGCSLGMDIFKSSPQDQLHNLQGLVQNENAGLAVQNLLRILRLWWQSIKLSMGPVERGGPCTGHRSIKSGLAAQVGLRSSQS